MNCARCLAAHPVVLLQPIISRGNRSLPLRHSDLARVLLARATTRAHLMAHGADHEPEETRLMEEDPSHACSNIRHGDPLITVDECLLAMGARRADRDWNLRCRLTSRTPGARPKPTHHAVFFMFSHDRLSSWNRATKAPTSSAQCASAPGACRLYTGAARESRIIILNTERTLIPHSRARYSDVRGCFASSSKM